MRKKYAVLILGFIAFISGNSVFATGNVIKSYEIPGQNCSASDNRICEAITNDLMKELIKQTVFTVGTQMLNKLNQPAAPAVTAPTYYTPSTTTTPVYYAPTPVTTTTTTVPATTTTTTQATTTTGQTTSSPQEDMVIIN